ncbi:MAG: NUDIX domain-containing protein [Candidatus Falkowbacteria bacterium]
MKTIESIINVINPSLCDAATYQAYQQKLAAGLPTRDEDPANHFCAYFLPYNPSTKKVFIVHHKKSGLWISPGGHIDAGETILGALNREINEELGVKDFFKELVMPFLLTITPIENEVQPCKTHYDVWYLVSTDGADFNIDPREFLDTKWLTFAEAEEIVTDPANLQALAKIKKL